MPVPTSSTTEILPLGPWKRARTRMLYPCRSKFGFYARAVLRSPGCRERASALPALYRFAVEDLATTHKAKRRDRLLARQLPRRACVNRAAGIPRAPLQREGRARLLQAERGPLRLVDTLATLGGTR